MRAIKTCTNCGISYPIEEFANRAASPDGKVYDCCACRNLKSRLASFRRRYEKYSKSPRLNVCDNLHGNDLRKVCEMQHYKCYLCGGYAYNVDHIIPLSKGGKNKIENLLAICRSCNASKGNRISGQYLAMAMRAKLNCLKEQASKKGFAMLSREQIAEACRRSAEKRRANAEERRAS